MFYFSDSNIYNNSILVQNKFLTETSEILASEKSVDLLVTCERIWQILVEPKNVVLHLIGNLDIIPDAAEPLTRFLPPNITPIQEKLVILIFINLILFSKFQVTCNTRFKITKTFD